VSAAQVGYAVILGGDQSIWLTGTLAIVVFLAGPVTALGVTNTPAPEDAARAWPDEVTG
jgi:hypothetical protein